MMFHAQNENSMKPVNKQLLYTEILLFLNLKQLASLLVGRVAQSV
jgi:hypothetical protein